MNNKMDFYKRLIESYKEVLKDESSDSTLFGCIAPIILFGSLGFIIWQGIDTFNKKCHLQHRDSKIEQKLKQNPIDSTKKDTIKYLNKINSYK